MTILCSVTPKLIIPKLTFVVSVTKMSIAHVNKLKLDLAVSGLNQMENQINWKFVFKKYNLNNKMINVTTC